MNAVLEVQRLKAAAHAAGYFAAFRNEPLDPTKPPSWREGWESYGARGHIPNKAQEAAQAGLRG